MGLSSYLAELIIREHRFKPLPPVIHTLGRLVVGLDPKGAVDLFEKCGVKPAEVKIEIDRETLESRMFREKHGLEFINDRTFFGMLGVEDVKSIDINAYEGASIIWDLCTPIPDELANTVDFVVGGSTLDNVFDPAQYIKNIARLLKPGGRLFEINIYVDRMRPYVILPPAWYFDFFVVNQFDDCKVYVVEHAGGQFHAFKTLVPFNPAQQVTWGLIDNFEASGDAILNVVVFAEKGPQSTWHISPVQDAWRNAEMVKSYNAALQRLLQHRRQYPELTIDENKPSSLSQHYPPRNYHYIGHF